MEIMNIENLTFWYPDTEKPALEDINLKVNAGELLLIVGPSGCGKSTLIRLLNRIIPDYYGGTIKGNVYLKGKKLRDLKKEEIVTNVGMVYQHPEKQIIFQDIEREICFGLENLNKDINTMKRNVAEVMSLLAINKLKGKTTFEISGGEKQKVAIASVVSMNPEIILFDEPISQLDPIMSEEVLNSIKRLNRDFGKTVILIEQRLDRCFDMADRVIFMEDGKIVEECNPHDISENIDKKYFLPSVSYAFKKSGFNDLPINVKEARMKVEKLKINCEDKNNIINEDKINQDNKAKESNKNKILDKINLFKNNKDENKALQVEKLKFSYEKGKEVLRDINFSLNKGEVVAVMGENGAGKSTLFKIISGVISKYSGKVIVNNKDMKELGKEARIKTIGYLSQNPNDYFGRETVFDEVGYTLKNIDEYDEEKVNKMLELLDLEKLKDRNPRDLSGGEKQRTAIACTLIADPDILILDEPTRGMDSLAKDNLGNIIKDLISKGKSIVLITHDSDFAADYADKVILMFNGEIVAKGEVTDILYDSLYYSPQIARVFKDKCKVIKTEDAIELLKNVYSEGVKI